MKNTYTVLVRGFKSGKLIFEDHIEMINEADVERLIPTLAAEHAAKMEDGTLGMIEMEFPDEPDPLDRFFRIGVETDGMVAPIEIHLDEKGPTQ